MGGTLNEHTKSYSINRGSIQFKGNLSVDLRWLLEKVRLTPQITTIEKLRGRLGEEALLEESLQMLFNFFILWLNCKGTMSKRS